MFFIVLVLSSSDVLTCASQTLPGLHGSPNVPLFQMQPPPSQDTSRVDLTFANQLETSQLPIESRRQEGHLILLRELKTDFTKSIMNVQEHLENGMFSSTS